MTDTQFVVVEYTREKENKKEKLFGIKELVTFLKTGKKGA